MDKMRIAKRETKFDFSNAAKSNRDYFSHTNKKMIYGHRAAKMVNFRIIQIWPQDEYFGSVLNMDDDVKQGCAANVNMRMEMELTTSKVDARLLKRLMGLSQLAVGSTS